MRNRKHAAAWRLRLLDADPDDQASRAAADRLQALADDLRRAELGPLWTELRSVCNWLGSPTRPRTTPTSPRTIVPGSAFMTTRETGPDYLRGLLAIAQGLIQG